MDGEKSVGHKSSLEVFRSFWQRSRSSVEAALVCGLMICIIAFFNLVMAQFQMGKVMYFVASVLQTFVSALVGHLYFSRVFGNETLKAMHEGILQVVAEISTASRPDQALDRMRIGLFRLIQKIPLPEMQQFQEDMSRKVSGLHNGSKSRLSAAEVLDGVFTVLSKELAAPRATETRAHIESPVQTPVIESHGANGNSPPN